MNTTALTITDYPGVTVTIHVDEDPLNPREDYDHLGTIACRDDHNYYTLGDSDASVDIGAIFSDALDAHEERVEAGIDSERPSDGWAEVKRYLIEERGALEESMVGLAMTDHSGLYLHVDVADGSNVGDGWDTAFIGWAYLTAEAAKELGDHAAPRDCALAEAREYAAYLSGDIYGYVVSDEDDDILESCWGFIGYDYAVEEAHAIGRFTAERLAIEAQAKRSELFAQAFAYAAYAS